MRQGYDLDRLEKDRRMVATMFIRYGMGRHAIDLNDWWCSLCEHTIGAKRELDRYYRSIISHYKYAHPYQFMYVVMGA